jgi:hypothetical protein
VSPARRLAAVEEVQRALPEVSERRACRVLGQPRAVQRYTARLWLDDGSCIRLRSERKDHVWAYDLVSARTYDGLPLRLRVVVDERTRECLAIDVARQLGSDDVLERLSWLMTTRGVPDHVRPHSDLGYRPPAPEAIAAGPPSASLRALQQRLPDRMTTA